MHGAIVNAGAQIGNNCIVNSQALLEHGVEVHDHCHISTGALINGDVTIGKGSFIGSGATIKESVRVGNNVVVGAGQVVLRDVPDGAVVKHERAKHQVSIIAEAGVNHNGDIELAKQLVNAAADAGADFVKFQTFKAERLATYAAPKAEYQTRTTDKAQSQFSMLSQLELNSEMHEILINPAVISILDFSPPVLMS